MDSDEFQTVADVLLERLKAGPEESRETWALFALLRADIAVVGHFMQTFVVEKLGLPRERVEAIRTLVFHTSMADSFKVFDPEVSLSHAEKARIARQHLNDQGPDRSDR